MTWYEARTEIKGAVGRRIEVELWDGDLERMADFLGGEVGTVSDDPCIFVAKGKQQVLLVVNTASNPWLVWAWTADGNVSPWVHVPIGAGLRLTEGGCVQVIPPDELAEDWHLVPEPESVRVRVPRHITISPLPSEEEGLSAWHRLRAR